MRVIHLINHCRFGHGNVHAAVDLACAQAAAGETAFIASGPGELTPLLAEQGVVHLPLDQESRRPIEVLRMVGRLRKLIRQHRPDVVHAHMMTGAVVGWLATRGSRTRLVTTIHNAFDKHAVLMGLGDRVIAVSRAVLEGMAERGLPRRKLRAVLNGTLGAPRRDFFGRRPTALLHPNVTTMCGLHDRKGVRDLLAAFDIVAREVPEAHLYIAGDGPDRRAYEAIAAASHASGRIHFLGELQDTKSLLEACDVFVLASHADPCPLVLPEAREAGCAIVATAVDGIPELLENGAAGVLTPPKDPVSLAAALTRLLKDPAALAEARAGAARNLDHWTTERVRRDTHAVYRELVRA
jgi:glycosyltransferase involved in cell wall biosynthesis